MFCQQDETSSQTSTMSTVSSEPVVAVVTCPRCAATVTSESDLDAHLSEHHPECVNFQCGHCKRRLITKSDFNCHHGDLHTRQVGHFLQTREGAAFSPLVPDFVYAIFPTVFFNDFQILRFDDHGPDLELINFS